MSSRKQYRNKPTRTLVSASSSSFAVAKERVPPTVLNKQELKSVIGYFENQQLYHTVVAYTNPTWPSQGTALNQRIGDSIELKMVRVKLWLSAKTSRPNVNYRVVYFTTSNGNFTGTDLMNGLPPMIAPIDNEEVRVLHDAVVKAPTTSYSGASYEDALVHWFDVPVNRSFAFRRATTSPNIIHYLAIIAYDAYGTLTSDNIASYAASFQVLYCDP